MLPRSADSNTTRVLIIRGVGLKPFARRRRSGGRSFTPVVVGLVGITAVIFFAHDRGWYVGDTQFYFPWNPGRTLSQGLAIWQDHTDLGGTISGVVFPPHAYLALLRGIGASAWFAQRVWFVTVLSGGAVGTAALARFFGVRRVAAFVAGCAFIASPFTVGFFYPTWLFLCAAICPWLALSALNGTCGDRGWRWAALPALLVASVVFNAPAVAFAALPVVAMLLYARVSSRAGWQTIIRWLVRVAVLLALALLPNAIASLSSRGAQLKNLASTEGIQAIALSSTWSESMRGLGGWLVYWNPGGRLTLPQVDAYLSNWVVVVCSFVSVGCAVAVVAITPRRARLVFGALFVGSASLMVGAYPLTAPPPFGWFVDRLYRQVPATFAFRNVYKAGAGLVVALAILLAFGAEWAMTTWRGRVVRLALATLTAFVLLATSFPLWSGAILRVNQRLHHQPPAYWYSATHWLDRRPGDGRVLVVPGSVFDQYRWGSTSNGDLFSSFLDRAVVLGGAFPGSQGDAGDLVQALNAYVSSGLYSPGTLAPIAKRLGIDYVLVRNDLAWRRTGVVRPSALESLRDDPDLHLAAVFGRPGENTVAAHDRGTADRRLPPVEIYSIGQPESAARAGTARATSDGPALLVSGDGEAWPELAGNGLLQLLGPVRYTGRIDGTTLRRELEKGAMVAVTDTNRRRSTAFGAQAVTLSRSVTTSVQDLFNRRGSQTVATYGDAKSIDYVGPPVLFAPGPAHGPWAAFDGDPSTSWLTGSFFSRGGKLLHVELKHPHDLTSIDVQAASGHDVRPVEQIRVSFGRGRSVVIPLDSTGRGTATFSARRTRAFDIAVDRLAPGGGAYGLADVSVSGLDLARRIEVPNDVIRVARRDHAVSRSLATAPIRYLFSRARGRTQDAEPSLRRRFEVGSSRDFQLTGSLAIDGHTPDAVVASLIGSSTMAIAADQTVAQDTHGMSAVDGDLSTAWFVPRRSTSTLAVQIPPTSVDSVEVRIPRNRAGALLNVTILANGSSATSSGFDCAPDAADSDTCTISVPLAVGDTNGFEVAVTSGSRKVGIDEIEVNGVGNTLPTAFDTCRSDIMTVDGAPVGITLTGSPNDLLAGHPSSFVACAPQTLTRGWHDLQGRNGLPVNSVALAGLGRRPPVFATTTSVTTASADATSLDIDVAGHSSAYVISGRAMSPQWKASADRSRVGATIELDTQAAWHVSAGADRSVSVSFAPQQGYRIALWISFAAFAVALLLVVLNPGARTRRPITPLRNAGTWLLAAEVLAVGFAFGVGGVAQAFLVIIAVVSYRNGWLSSRLIAFAAVVGIALVVAATVPPLGPSLAPVNPGWALQRDVAHFVAMQSAVLLVAALLGFARAATNTSTTKASSSVSARRVEDVAEIDAGPPARSGMYVDR